jgi:hypothetical protein
MKKRNSDFKGTPVILPDPLSPHWPIAEFKHLRPEYVPPIFDFIECK